MYMYVCTHACSEEAKRFEEGLQEHKDFLYIQKKYVRQPLIGLGESI